MPSIVRDALHRLAPLDARPRYWRPLVAVEATLVATLVVVTVAVAAFGHDTVLEPLYRVVLPAVLFYAPPVLGVLCAVLDGGLVQALAFGTVPALGWTLAVVVGDAIQALLSIPAAIPDSPLWAIAGAFLAIGLVGALAGFVGGRGWLLVSRRFSSEDGSSVSGASGSTGTDTGDAGGWTPWRASFLLFGVAVAALVAVTLASALSRGTATALSGVAILAGVCVPALPAAVDGARGRGPLLSLSLGLVPGLCWVGSFLVGSGVSWLLRGAPPMPLPSTTGLSVFGVVAGGVLVGGVVAAAVGFGLGRTLGSVRERRRA